jgi:hypothetical protein
MVLSIHDNRLISYEVQCETRTILFRTAYRVKSKPTEFTNVTFKDVQGYHFEHDAFGNIIFGLETMSMEQFLAEYGTEISEYYRMAGSPGPWAENLATAPEHLQAQGVQAFILSSSYGLSGWVLAREISIFPAQQVCPTDHPDASPV